MNYFLASLLFMAGAYAAFILWCFAGWKKLKLHTTSSGNFKTFISVVVPARNEEKNISACILDILNQDYPKELIEIIVVDDFSEDKTSAVVMEIIEKNRDRKILLLKNDEDGNGKRYKKQAIAKAIENAAGELIVTTDADCRMNRSWLSAIASYYENEHPFMIAAPVCFQGESNNFERLQSLEFSGLTGIGAGAISNRYPVMCNGANLAYTKNIFRRVNGFEGDTGTPSGDDTQLMLKIAQINPGKIHFLKSKEAIVYTSAVCSPADFFQQRKRWASKIPSKMNALTRIAGCIAYLLHFGSLLLILFCLFQFSMSKNALLVLFFIITLKSLPEYLLLNSLNIFYSKKNILWLFLPAQVLYILYISFMGPASLFGSYTWKERTIASSAIKFTSS